MGTQGYNILDKLVIFHKIYYLRKYFKRSDRILDFGCGHQAYLLRYLKGKIKSGIGLDYDVENYEDGSIQLIKHRFKKKLPFGKYSFNKIVMLAVLEHINLDETGKLFNEYHRILTDEGRLILTTPTPFGRPILEFMAFKLGIISKVEMADHKKYYDRGDIEELTRKTGFKIVTYRTFQLGMNSFCIMQKA